MRVTSSGCGRQWIRILVVAACGGVAIGQVTARVSVRSDGGQAAGGFWGSFGESMSANGRFVAFASEADNLVQNDNNGDSDIFLHDRQTGTTQCVSRLPWGWLGNDESRSPTLSENGRFLVFESLASNLVTGDTNSSPDTFVSDLMNNTIERVNVSSSQAQANGLSEGGGSVTSDGRFVVFSSWASNLAPGGTNAYSQVYLRDRQNQTTELVSVDSSENPADAHSSMCEITEDGRFVVFSSTSANLVAGDTNGVSDVFLRDRQSGTTVRVSVDSNGTEALGHSGGGRITSDGRFVVFFSDAPNLAAGDTNGATDVFLRDLQSGTTELVSLADDGSRGNGPSDWAEVSLDGRWIVFHSDATNLVPGDTNGWEDMFLRDRVTMTTERMNVASDGTQTSGSLGGLWPDVSDDGRFVAFSGTSPDLVPMDTNAKYDVFVRDHTPGAGTTAFTSFCDPGSAGVIPCPCSNPASGPGRGCDNSAGTGGAQLSAAGIARISADSVVFSVTGELPSVLSIFVQAQATVPNGTVYGQGVRCFGGHLTRLYTKSASGGAIVAPDPAMGELPITVRASQKGDLIRGGQTRWYGVYYRDPNVLGGCPASSTFNSTQTGEIYWTF